VDGTRVIEHRFSLSGYERQQLDTLVTGMTVRNVSDPAVKLLSDVSALVALTTLLEALGVIDLTGWAWAGASNLIDQIKLGLFETIPEYIDKALENIADEFGVSIEGLPVKLTPAILSQGLSELEAGKRAQAQRAIDQATSLPTRLYVWAAIQTRKLGGSILG
jgi:hypothetical protein